MLDATGAGSVICDVGLNEYSKATTVCFGPFRPECRVRLPPFCYYHSQLHRPRNRFNPATFLVGWSRFSGGHFHNCSLSDMVLALKTKPNHRAALDAGRAICLRIQRYGPGGSERGRWGPHSDRLRYGGSNEEGRSSDASVSEHRV